MNRKSLKLSNDFARDGRILNAIITDPYKPIYELPNYCSDVTNCPERAYYSKDVILQRPLSEIDEPEEIWVNPEHLKAKEEIRKTLK